jgi:DHA3 family tetracycline resistance protein-like MFS transporter
MNALASSLAWTVMMVYFVETVSMNPLQLVLTGTVMEATLFLMEVPTGVVADVYSRRMSIIIGVTIMGISFFLSSIPVVGIVLLAQSIWGLGHTFTSGATHAWLSDEIGEERANRAFLRGSQAATLFGIVGMVISVAIASLEIRLAIASSGVLYLLLSGFLILFMPETGFQPIPFEERHTWKDMRNTFTQGIRTVKSRPVLVNILLVGVIIGMFSEGYDRLSTAHLIEQFTFPQLGDFQPVVWFGIISVVGSLLYLGVTESLIRRLDMAHSAKIVRILQIVNAILIAALLAFALAGNFWLAILMIWLIGILRGIGYPLHEAWLNQGLDPKVRATIFSMAGQTDAFGEIVGGPIIGWLATRTSIRAGLVGSALLLMPIVWLFRLALRHYKSQETSPTEITEPVVV